MRCFSFLALAASAAAAVVAKSDNKQFPLARGTPSISIISPNLTTKWIDGSDYVQIIELFVENTHPTKFLTKRHDLKVTVDSDYIETVQPGTVTRLAPGQKALIQVGVKNKAGVKDGSKCGGKVIARYGAGKCNRSAEAELSGVCGIGSYDATEDDLLVHRTPNWFDNIKYGIFIHWGIYSVPAYGNTGENENYAEWYWWWMQNPNDKTQTYQYHLEHYGKDVNYDDFAQNFTGAKFNPKEWVDLFADAGAQYFVPTTKHHDGFALFDFPETVSRRSTVHYGPKRDFIKDLFVASKKYQPHLRLGTYFSLPEFFSPSYRGAFPGGPPKNPYTGEVIEYTGYVPTDDFVNDIQVPQMNALAYEYDTEIMWCDIGGPNNSTHMLSKWINWAKESGRQVTFNKRCGLKGDFDTPEYDPNPTNPFDRKWESSRGMDPHSYGYNKVTPDDEYMTGHEIVKGLIDIVSNNGNFLLDIGPDGEGAIPAIMQKGLLDAGKWIKAHSESIFNTKYWPTTAGKDPFRYTTTDEAFYIHYTETPPKELSIADPVPFLPGDKVSVLGGSMDGTPIEATWDGIGSLKLLLTDEIISADEYVWTFKVEYSSLV